MGIQSFFSGVSGLESHSTWLDVIGNNISNANTVAYKSSRLKFADQLNATLSEGQGASGSLGGVSPLQLGTGTRVASIETLFTQGSNLDTGRNLDLAIQGDGFFMVQNGDQRFYTRDGNLSLDGVGNLVDASGGYIQGIVTQGAGTSSELYDVDKGNPPYTSIDPPQYLATTHSTFGPLNRGLDAVGNIRIEPNMELPAKDTTSLSLGGNLDAGLSATQTGGILDLAPDGKPVLPLAIGMTAATVGDETNGFFGVTAIGTNGDFALHQLKGLTSPVVGSGVALSVAKANDSNAWEQSSYTPASTSTETVYDQQGNARQISFLFYQVNDLGDGGINSTSGPSQAAYAWYAFDTTGGQSASNSNLLGGTGILEGEVDGQNPPGYNRGVWGDQYTGDLLYFNTDGSLKSQGATSFNQLEDPARADISASPRIYLPASQSSGSANSGDGVTDISVSFGTVGQRDGVYSDAAGSYSGSVYTAQSNVQGVSQDGYGAGILKSETLSVGTDGVVSGTFTNGKTMELARIAMARFSNPEGLYKAGNNYYSQSANSGPLEIGFAGEGTIGTIASGTLESSNVDMSDELSNMIIAQRSYELNSRTIGVSNETWKTAIDMKP